MNGVAEHNSSEIGQICKMMIEFIPSEMPTKLPFSARVNILGSSLRKNESTSRPDYLPGEIRTWREQRLARILAIEGKYASVLTSSEEFARRKREEIELER